MDFKSKDKDVIEVHAFSFNSRSLTKDLHLLFKNYNYFL